MQLLHQLTTFLFGAVLMIRKKDQTLVIHHFYNFSSKSILHATAYQKAGFPNQVGNMKTILMCLYVHLTFL